jgi:hypothetical protein
MVQSFFCTLFWNMLHCWAHKLFIVQIWILIGLMSNYIIVFTSLHKLSNCTFLGLVLVLLLQAFSLSSSQLFRYFLKTKVKSWRISNPHRKSSNLKSVIQSNNGIFNQYLLQWQRTYQIQWYKLFLGIFSGIWGLISFSNIIIFNYYIWKLYQNLI